MVKNIITKEKEARGIPGLKVSLPLDGSTGFGREVIQNTVYALDLRQNPLCDLVEKGPRHLLHCGGHSILGVDSTNDDGPIPKTLSVLHSGGAIIGDDCEVLPHLALESCLRELLAKDCVRFPDCFETVACDGPRTAYT